MVAGKCLRFFYYFLGAYFRDDKEKKMTKYKTLAITARNNGFVWRIYIFQKL